MSENDFTPCCYDCEYFAKAGHTLICNAAVTITDQLMADATDCKQWEALDLERRAKRDAEIAAQVKPPEPPKTNWQRIERVMIDDMAENPEQWRRGYLSGYPVDDDRMYRRHGDRIPHPMRNERIPYRVPQHDNPTLGELADVQRNLPDPNRYSGEEIFYEIARCGLDYCATERLRLRFAKVALFHNGERFFRWGYQGQVLMEPHNHREMLEEFIEERRQIARYDIDRRNREIRRSEYLGDQS